MSLITFMTEKLKLKQMMQINKIKNNGLEIEWFGRESIKRKKKTVFILFNLKLKGFNISIGIYKCSRTNSACLIKR